MSAARRKPSGARPAAKDAAAADGRDAAPQAATATAPVRRLTDADARSRRGGPAPARRTPDDDAPLTRSRPFAENVGIVVAAFVGSTLIAEVAGAANLGTALSFGQLGFAGALVWVLLRR